MFRHFKCSHNIFDQSLRCELSIVCHSFKLLFSIHGMKFDVIVDIVGASKKVGFFQWNDVDSVILG